MSQNLTSSPAAPRAAPISAREPSATSWLGLGLLAAGVGITVWITLTLTAYSGRVSPVWVANALVLACLLRVAPRHWSRDWPRLLLAGFAGVFTANLAIGDNPLVGAGLALCNTLEIGLCAWLVRRFVQGRPLDLSRLDDLAVLAAGACTAPWVAAGLAWLALGAAYGTFEPGGFVTWGLADMLGLLIFTPVLLALPAGALNPRRATAAPLPAWNRLPWGRVALAASLVAGIVVLCLTPHRFPLLLFSLPLAGILTLAFEFTGVALAVVAIAAASMARGFLGIPLFEGTQYSAIEQIMLLQVMLALTTLGFAPIAGLLVHRRRSEARAIEASRQAELAGELARVGYWRREPHTGEGVWSDQVFDAFGLPRGDAPPPIADVVARIHPDDRATALAQYGATAATGEEFTFEHRVVRPNGEVRTIVGRSTAELDGLGRVQAVFGSVMDVTEQRESETRYRVLAENGTDVIGRFDLSGTFLYLSPSVLPTLGYTPEEMVGRPVVDFIHPDDVEPTRANVIAFVRAGAGAPSPRYEYRARKRDGAYIWVEAHPRLIVDADGRPVEIQDCVRDITARKAAQAELEAAMQDAQAAARAKADFLSNMSHELRTPLTSIIGFSGLLAGSAGVGEAERRYVNRIETASQALLSVINDVLDYSKLEAEGLELDSHPFDAHALLAESLGLLAPQAEAKDLVLNLVIEPGATECEDEALLLGDGARLRQVLLNLLSNAVKFTSEGGVTLRATLAQAGAGARRLDVTVADTGIGIAPDQIERLFERFTQADGSVSRRFGGTGLGLSISQRLVQMMGGDITVESRPGQGSEFSFSVVLPLARDSAGRGVDSGSGEVGPGASLAGLRILVADDAEANRELMTAYLRALDAEVDTAADGAGAVRAVGQKHYDLVLMDVNMPAMDGLAATRAIRAMGGELAELPIVALTADVGPGDIACCLAAGMNGHVAKPIIPAELHAALERTLFRKAA